MQFALLSILSMAQMLTRHFISSPQARCLDGSAPSFFMDTVKDAKGTLIFLQQGGVCISDSLEKSLQNCYNRSLTRLDQQTFHFTVLDPNPKINPLFANYNRIFGRYCDGSIHVGFRSEPSVYNQKKLFFRGAINSRELFYDIYKLGLLKGQVVLTGSSAGGEATAIWGDWVANQFKIKPMLIPDSGIFINQQQSGNFVANINKIMMSFLISERRDLHPQNCTQAVPDCFNYAWVYSQVKSRTLVISMLYDSWDLFYVAGLVCIEKRLSLGDCSLQQQRLANKFNQRAKSMLLSLQKHISFLALGCAEHMLMKNYLYNNDLYRVNYPQGPTLQQAIALWLIGKDFRLFDQNLYPYSNMGCAKPLGFMENQASRPRVE